MRLTIGAIVESRSSLGMVTQLTVTENVVITPLPGSGIGTRLPADEVLVVVEAPLPDFHYGQAVRINAPWLASESFTVVGVSTTMVTVATHDNRTMNYSRECVYALR